MAKKYCSIYSKLVQSEGDMIGHIAYSLYKAEKVQYINEYKESNKVDIVPDSAINSFTAGRDNQKSLEHYRGMAETILQSFIGGSFDDMSEQVISEVTGRLTQHMDNTITPLLPTKESWWAKFGNGILQSMVGTFLMAFVVWGIVSVVSKYNVEGILPPQGVGPQIEQVETPPATTDSIPTQLNLNTEPAPNNKKEGFPAHK